MEIQRPGQPAFGICTIHKLLATENRNCFSAYTSNRGYKGCTTMMSLSLDEPRPIDSRGRASPPGRPHLVSYQVSCI